jgi:hypothetical protein
MTGCRSVGELAITRRLLLKRLRHLVEQPDVLDGDHRLIGEGLEKSDLGVGKRPAFLSVDGDRPDRISVP